MPAPPPESEPAMVTAIAASWRGLLITSPRARGEADLRANAGRSGEARLRILSYRRAPSPGSPSAPPLPQQKKNPSPPHKTQATRHDRPRRASAPSTTPRKSCAAVPGSAASDSAEITATPSAPAAITSAALPAVMPAMAQIGNSGSRARRPPLRSRAGRRCRSAPRYCPSRWCRRRRRSRHNRDARAARRSPAPRS